MQGLSFLRLDGSGLIASLYDAPEFPMKLDVRALPLLNAAATLLSRLFPFPAPALFSLPLLHALRPHCCRLEWQLPPRVGFLRGTLSPAMLFYHSSTCHI